MSIAQMQVTVDQKGIRKQISEQLDEVYREAMFTWDVEEIVKRT